MTYKCKICGREVKHFRLHHNDISEAKYFQNFPDEHSVNVLKKADCSLTPVELLELYYNKKTEAAKCWYKNDVAEMDLTGFSL